MRITIKRGNSRKKRSSPKTGRKGDEKDLDFPADFGAKKYRFVTNIGAEGRIIFSSQEDFDRFEAYLYLLNSTESPRAANFFTSGKPKGVFEVGRGEKLIAIGAYSFTPKEFHILAAELVPGGIAKFMQKLQTAYTMYYNKKYSHTGRVFHAAYRPHEIISEEYLKYFFSLTHLSAAVLFNDTWDETNSSELLALATRATKYRYSSIGEYLSGKFLITSPEYFPPSLRRARDIESHLKFWTRMRREM